MKWRWTQEELAESWHMGESELSFLGRRTGLNRLGLAVLLKFFQKEGRFPSSLRSIPTDILIFVADQVRVDYREMASYDWSGRTAKRQRTEVLAFLGIQRFQPTHRKSLKAWLKADVLPLSLSLTQMKELTGEWFHERRLEPLSEASLERLLRSEARQFESALVETIASTLSEETKMALESLLQTNSAEPSQEEGQEETLSFSALKADPGRTSLKSVLEELAKLKRVRDLELPGSLALGISNKQIQKLAQRAASTPVADFKKHTDSRRYALLTAFCWQRQEEIIDGLVNLLIQVIHKIGTRAENKVEKELLDDFRRVRGKAKVLFQLAEVAIDAPEGKIKDVLYPVVNLDTLKALVKEFKASGPAYRKVLHTVIRGSYGSHYRRMLQPVLDALEFKSSNTLHQPVIEALAVLRKHHSSQQKYFSVDDVPIQGVIRKGWREIIVETDRHGQERINRISYELCVLQALRERLRSKEIWVVGAHRYRNPDEDLPQGFEAKRAEYYAALKLPENPSDFLTQLQNEMKSQLTCLNAGFPKNSKVKLRPTGKNRIVLTPLDPQPEPINLDRLKAELFQRWHSTSLLDVLKEADLRIGFSEAFHSAGSREILDRDTLQRRLLLCLYGLGTNTGLKRLFPVENGISYRELLYVRQRFIRKSALREAISKIVDATFAIRQSNIWGEGSTACASDSKKFGAWDQNLMTEWHIRYGGRGVMIYWHVERKSVCIYSQLKRCSSSEVAAMIEGVLRHNSEMDVQKNYTDSHGQSEVGFAFCHLLGFDLLPRLKAIASQKLYLPEAGLEYSNLDGILTRPIQWELIRQQYDEMVKYTTALRLGTADAETILRRFTRGNQQHPTYRALAEIGKAIKTIFLCRYLHSEALRREIHEGLNVVENWNSANSFIFYGKSGEVASNRLEDQELSVLSLQLLQLCLVYVNTLMIQRVLSEPTWLQKMEATDFRALSPLIYSHINPYGRFELDMDKRLVIEELAA
jgi:TnpA family transposase